MSAAAHAPAPFVVGVSRSGTTVLRLMLDAHRQLAIPPETQFLAHLVALDARTATWRDDAVARMLAFASWNDFGIGAAEVRAAVARERPASVGDLMRWFYRTYAKRHGKPRWGDKTPGHVRRMNAIAAVLPEARFVHIVRDGLDVAASLRDTWFGPASYVACVTMWRELITSARAQSRAGFPYLEVRYETLIAEPDATLRRICAFIDCDYDPAMLTYPERAARRLAELSDTPAATREMRLALHASAAEPLASNRIGRWRNVMTSDELAACTIAGGELLDEFRAPA